MAEESASWYQRKMAQMQGAVQQRPFQQARPVPTYQQQPQGYQQQQPPPGYQPAPPEGGEHAETFSEFLVLQNQGVGLRPGKGARLNQEPCPGCGGNLYYADMGMKRRGPPPAPRCFTCGYNELFEQGLESNWQSGV